LEIGADSIVRRLELHAFFLAAAVEEAVAVVKAAAAGPIGIVSPANIATKEPEAATSMGAVPAE